MNGPGAGKPRRRTGLRRCGELVQRADAGRLLRIESRRLVADQIGALEDCARKALLVIGVHAGYIDTDMAAEVSSAKSRPEDVAAAIIAGIENNRSEEILADERGHGPPAPNY